MSLNNIVDNGQEYGLRLTADRLRLLNIQGMDVPEFSVVSGTRSASFTNNSNPVGISYSTFDEYVFLHINSFSVPVANQSGSDGVIEIQLSDIPLPLLGNTVRGSGIISYDGNKPVSVILGRINNDIEIVISSDSLGDITHEDSPAVDLEFLGATIVYRA